MEDAPETRYEREIRLAKGDNEAREASVAISGKVETLVAFLFPKAKGYRVTPRPEKGAETSLSVSTADWKIELTCQAGNNMKYIDGREVRYFSYFIHAQSVIPAVIKAEKLGKELGFWLKVVFAAVFCALLLLGCFALMEALGMDSISIPALLFAVAIALGGAVGKAVGEFIGGIATAFAYFKARRLSGVENALADWGKLEEGLDRILDSAEISTDD